MVSIHKNQADAQQNLQNDFKKFQRYAHDKELTIDFEKTEILHISSPNLSRDGKVKIITHSYECLHQLSDSLNCSCKNYLRQVKTFKYLGLVIDETLSWRTHTDNLYKKLSLCSMRMHNLNGICLKV